jgi:hypothetical protein
MISLCAVSTPVLEQTGVMDMFRESVKRNLRLVNEVIVVSSSEVEPPHTDTAGGVQHALCLHRALSKATNKYVLFSDPDIFFYTSVDQFYLELMAEHRLDVIGISHQDATSFAHRFFPTVTNMLVKKDHLPGPAWLEGEIRLATGYRRGDKPLEPLDGMFLIPGCVPSQANKYPNPDGLYETGCLLMAWAQDANWRWLSFQTADCHRYSSAYNRSNFKIGKPLPRRLLLYHGTHSVILDHKREAFINAYKEHSLAPTHGTKP